MGGGVASAVETPARLQAASAAGRPTWIGVCGTLSAMPPIVHSRGARSRLRKVLSVRHHISAPPTCSATTAMDKPSNALQETVVAATCAWQQATSAAQTWRATTSLAKETVASAVGTPAQLRAASAADRHTSRGVGGILPASTPSVPSKFFVPGCCISQPREASPEAGGLWNLNLA